MAVSASGRCMGRSTAHAGRDVVLVASGVVLAAVAVVGGDAGTLSSLSRARAGSETIRQSRNTNAAVRLTMEHGVLAGERALSRAGRRHSGTDATGSLRDDALGTQRLTGGKRCG